MHGLQTHSCAVLSSGAVSCWGYNAYGQVSALADLRGGCVCAWGVAVCADVRCFVQVGDGTSGTNRLTPVAVVGLGSGVANVALGAVRLFVQRVCLCFFFGGVVGVRLRGLCCCGVLSLRFGGGRSGWLRVVVGVGCGVMRGARGGPHAWFTDAFLCCSKQWGGLLLGAE